jgi:hypothetical protein
MSQKVDKKTKKLNEKYVDFGAAFFVFKISTSQNLRAKPSIVGVNSLKNKQKLK